MFLIVLAVIIIHFIINADHHSNPGLVLANQILLIAGMILIYRIKREINSGGDSDDDACRPACE